MSINQGHITLFWACTPHQLTDTGTCQSMAIFNLPMHLFLSPLDKDLINHVTHGMVIKSLATQQLSPFEAPLAAGIEQSERANSPARH
ncbi:hypothetical protein DMI60_00925 [Escherichia coli]|nr:hypothetical protein [Escherichia coli]